MVPLLFRPWQFFTHSRGGATPKVSRREAYNPNFANWFVPQQHLQARFAEAGDSSFRR